MFLFFKIRDIVELSIDDQKEYLERYLNHFCNLESIGIRFVDYIEHSINVDLETTDSYIVSTYNVSETADFTALELKIKIHELHKRFLIIAVI